MTISSTVAAPVSQSERITILDSLRGIAILGILLMNMPAFSLAGVVAFDPTMMHEQGTINYYLWYFVEWMMTGTQRALFSMLFGAGIILFVGRQENKVDGLQPADYFFRRQLWLIAISLFDVFILLWNGDILLDYACIGMLLFAFRKLSPKALLLAAGISLIFMVARENRDFFKEKSNISRGEAVAAMDTTVTKLTAKQKKELEEMTSFRDRMKPEGKLKRMKETNEILQGSDYAAIYQWRTDNYTNSIVSYLYFGLWDVVIFMFLGMAFFKMGILTGNASVKVYVLLTVVGLGVGLGLSYLRLQEFIDSGFNWFNLVKNAHVSYFEFERTFRSVGLLGLIMLLYKSNLFNWLFAILRPVGQMALTNYLSQSLICSIIFHGFGFGLFGKLHRYEIYEVVLSIWIFQIIFCNIWMRYFQYGPCEWIWRSLTYWKKQPFVKA